ncbi:hypothetical protein FC16_GL000076 [Loigolactobacillus coryniformis subsp. torquens DSM 20004 = KCTC 3535]|nr:hypothetical protein FD22_GL002500 [Loigolactobacillus coryniformis subsp. coryniformis KCTC 3167 = DSM 20001]KRK85169.1 hypothetical protein FC16_GL000076 [Loigolactobacillus coryniformis subsp. torquens DSM 20004 = KCTC 3535]
MFTRRRQHYSRSQWTQQQQWQHYGRSEYHQHHHDQRQKQRKNARDVKVQDDDWSDF